MSQIDYEAEYNNRRRVPDSAEFVARWTSASGRARDSLSPYYEHRYGQRARNMLDLFRTERRSHSTPLVVYIHGGYWQRGDRKDYSFIASRLVERGLDVAIPSYTLCPEVGIAEIVDEMRLCMADLWTRTGRRPLVVGHSAGGHLAAAMLATDWSKVPSVPDDLVRAAYAISGVFELAPLIPTSLNDALSLTPQTAVRDSPICWLPPPSGRVLVAAVGGDESTEFIRQSLAITAIWSKANVMAECVIIPSAHHFSIVDEFARADGPMVSRIVELGRMV